MDGKQFVLSLLFTLGLILPGCASEKVDDPFREDLTSATWYAKQGFAPSDRDGFFEESKIKVIKEFPIQLNSVFDVPSGGKINEFALGTEIELSSIPDRSLGMYLAWIGEGWDLYVNGTLVRKELYLEPGGEHLERYRSFRGVIISLPVSVFQKGKNRIVFHIAGYPAPLSWIQNGDVGFLYSEPFELGDLEALQKKYSEYTMIALNTVYFFFGLYHLIVFARRTQDRFNLFFGLMCIALSMDGFSKTLLAGTLFMDNSYLARLKYGSQATLVPTILLFHVTYLYSGQKLSRAAKSVIVAGLFFVVAFAFAPIRYVETVLIFFQISILPMMGYLIVAVGGAFRRKRPDSGKILAAGSVLLLSILWDILDDRVFNTGLRLMRFGFLAYIFLLVTILVERFMRAQRDSERLNVEMGKQKDAFFRFVPTEFLQILGKDSAVDILPGDSSLRSMTVMFGDIRAFTSLSEGMDTAQNFRFLNELLQSMEPIIKKNYGFVDKYIGDAILALYADDDTFNSSTRAVQAACEMQRALRKFNESYSGPLDQPVKFGIGLNTGNLMLGTVGSSNRLDTTVIGDTVNVAARVEQLNKLYGTEVILTDSVYDYLTEQEKSVCREIDRVAVRGRQKPVVLYEAFGGNQQFYIDRKQQDAAEFARGVELYRKREFQEAEEIFRRILRSNELDSVAAVYVERCHRYANSPPPETWQGVIQHT